MTIPVTSSAKPVSQKERIILLDSLRGTAVLGILLMNITAFAYSGVLEADPFIRNESTLNFRIWHFVNVFISGSQRALFSMLFGAGILLFVGRKEQTLKGLETADYFFRRQLWLIVFSLVDVFILWWQSDILLHFAIIGMAMFVSRNLTPKQLIIGAVVCLMLMVARENRDLYKRKKLIARGEAVAALNLPTDSLTFLQKAQLQAMKEFRYVTSTEGKLKRITADNARVLGNLASTYGYRTNIYVDSLIPNLFYAVWDVPIFMFLGMAFFKLGILTGSAPVRTYLWMAIVGLSIGLILSYIRIQYRVEAKADLFETTKNMHVAFFHLDRVFRAIGIVASFMLLYKSGIFDWLFSKLQPVGQMALTNYLGQSAICSFIFNGFGLGLFGKLERYEIYLVVLAIWIFQVLFSVIWMRYFLYGPCEWAWRSATYWRLQPFVKGN